MHDTHTGAARLWAVLRAELTARAWSEAAYCLAGLPVALVGFVLVLVLLAIGAAFTVSLAGAVLGLLLVVTATGLARAVAAAHRGLAARLLGERVPAPPRLRPAGAGVHPSRRAAAGRRRMALGGVRAGQAARRRRPVLRPELVGHTRLLAAGSAGVGCLLKDRVANVAEFTDALHRVAGGGTALDPEVVTQLAGAARGAEALESLTAREGQVLALMAEGRSNAAVAQALEVSAGTVEKHVAAVFAKLGLPASQDANRRVLAVLRYLGA
ncbi:response regulator transcription factor [Streptomyces sp. NPDC101225]|uniref:helix-turn-helix transcriptional regulator n=1 Tax=Streptomyces sp. NPDC101225 TaxID=3366135 RepID=UPI0037F27415